MLPNDLGVYLHDTPLRGLFAGADRRQSSGCVRVEDAARLERWLFQGRIPQPSGAPEQRVDLPEPVPVYIAYFTALPSRDGPTFLPDVYPGTAQRGVRAPARPEPPEASPARSWRGSAGTLPPLIASARGRPAALGRRLGRRADRPLAARAELIGQPRRKLARPFISWDCADGLSEAEPDRHDLRPVDSCRDRRRDPPRANHRIQHTGGRSADRPACRWGALMNSTTGQPDRATKGGFVGSPVPRTSLDSGAPARARPPSRRLAAVDSYPRRRPPRSAAPPVDPRISSPPKQSRARPGRFAAAVDHRRAAPHIMPGLNRGFRIRKLPAVGEAVRRNIEDADDLRLIEPDDALAER